MKIYFLGGWFPDDLENKIVLKSKKNIQFAANNLQKSLINGLKEHYNDILLLSIPFIGSYPLRSRILISPKYNKENEFVFSFFNLLFVKQLSIYRTIIHAFRKKIDKSSNLNIIVIYSIQIPYLKAAVAYKQKNNNVRIIVIVPDLLEYMGGPRGYFYSIFKKYSQNEFIKIMGDIDGYVLLCESMKDKLNIGNKPYEVLEGIYSNNYNLEFTNTPSTGKKIIFYAGNLDERYGIIKLVEAFKGIDDDTYELWIRGDGRCKSYVLNEIEEDNRIRYYDKMDLSELLFLYKKATLLVNPVSPENEFTEFFFPSKTFDYMASGTPVLMFELKCLPQEYLSYMYFFTDSTIEGMRQKMTNICQLPQEELDEFGKKASHFVTNQKTAIKQTEKIYNLVTKIMKIHV